MTDKKPELSFEETLEQYYAAPEPRPAFLAGLEQRLAHLPAPAPAAPRPRLRLAYAGLALVVALVISLAAVGPGRVLAAIRGLVGYIPGFGLVEDNTSLRVLAEPVSVTREGVTVTVTQAVVSPDRSSVSITMKDIPPLAIPEWVATDRDRICAPLPELRLSDGTIVQGNGGGGGYVENVYQYNYFFQPLPAGVQSATFYLPCLPETLTGKAPGEWEITLNLKPAPPGMAPLPVVEITPAATEQVYPLSLDRVIETEDGYIFTGSFAPGINRFVNNFMPEIRDGNDHLLGFTIPADVTNDTGATAWAYRVRGKEQAWPVTIRFNSLNFVCEAEDGFTLDTGENPQVGQEWAVDRDFYSGECAFHLDTVERIDGGYQFNITAKNKDVTPVIEGYELKSYETQIVPGGLWVRLTYNGAVPAGELPITFFVYAEVPGPWEVQWQPEP